MSTRLRHFSRNFIIATIITATVLSFTLIRFSWNAPHTARAAAPSGYSLPYNNADFKSDVVYEVLLDRFFDGNTANNNPSGDTGLYDSTKSNWKLYWGGDLQGLTQKLQYLADMGITSLWILPIADNIHTAAVYNGQPNAGYHGYWARDMYQIDPHLGTWADFDNLVATAHSKGIKIMIDFAPNHSNPNDTGEYGSMYKNGVFQASYTNDPNGWFHKNGGITDYNNLYQDEYYNLADLSDLAQENPSVDSYLRGAMSTLLSHGVDGIRVDAVKHMPAGWDRTLADLVETNNPHYMVGEWYLSSISDPTYSASAKFADQSGIALLNFPLNNVLRNVFAQNGDATQIDSVLTKMGSDFTWLNDQGVFIDNHDMPRFQSLNSSNVALEQAFATMLTTPGVPIIYYGTEQYLHNDTNGGGDPYNRPMMTNFDETTPAFQVIKQLSNLRHNNPALAYGTYLQRWMNSDVIIYERQFFNNVVLYAVNKSPVNDYNISGLATNLPQGTYGDVLNGLLGGGNITVGSGGAVAPFTLAHGQVATWQYTASEPSAPEIGSVGPELVRPGTTAIIDGAGFGSSGSVYFGSAAATVQSYTAHSITVTVPNAPGNNVQVDVCTVICSNTFKVNVSSAAQVPVTFTVNNAPPTNVGDNVYLTGAPAELSGWNTTTNTAVGPFFAPNYPNWFDMASVPACQTIQFKFIIIRADGTVQWENGANHSYTTPCSGPGYVNVTWQN